jgi:hypothetical protein
MLQGSEEGAISVDHETTPPQKKRHWSYWAIRGGILVVLIVAIVLIIVYFNEVSQGM